MPPRNKRPAPEEEDPYVRSVRQEAMQACTDLEEMEEQEAIDKVLSLSSEWEVDNDLRIPEMIDLAFRNFRWEETEARSQSDMGLNRLMRVIQLKQTEVSTLMYTLKKLDLLEDDLTYTRIRKVVEKVFHATRLCLSAVQLKITDSFAHTVPKNVDEELRLLAIRFRWMDGVDPAIIHQLVWYLLDVAFEHGYRKHGSNIFEPIVSNGHRTHAYRRVCDVKAFVHRQCRKETNFEAHMHLLKVPINAVVDYLENSVDLQLPFLDKDRSVFSFKNGIYACSTDTFYPYGAVTLSEDTISANYFDIDMDEGILEQHWHDIETPNVEKIFMDQKMSVTLRRWFYVMAGRMMYDLGERDGWQVIPFLLGVAGSGKSTITDMLIGSLYDRVDVGVLSNNCERQWAVSGLINSLLWVCPEVKDDFQLEQVRIDTHPLVACRLFLSYPYALPVSLICTFCLRQFFKAWYLARAYQSPKNTRHRTRPGSNYLGG